MKIAKPVHVFALPAVAPESKLIPLKSILANGASTGVPDAAVSAAIKRFSDVTWRPAGIHLPADPAAPANSAPVSVQLPPGPEKWGLVQGYKAAAPWVKRTSPIALLKVTESATQAQVIHAATSLGFPEQQAKSVADTALAFVNSHGGHAAVFGVAVGGAGAAVASFFGYKEWAASIFGLLACLASIGFYFLVHEQSPFIGKWVMNALETSYQSGAPPREASCDIAPDGGSLKISTVSIAEEGKRTIASYQIDPDGKSHPFSQRNADYVTATAKGNTLDITFRAKGQIIEHETRSLSADQKRMTVTVSGKQPTGQPYTDVTVYDRK